MSVPFDAKKLDTLEMMLDQLEDAGFDVRMLKEHFHVGGEWLLAFEGVYYFHRRYPGVLDATLIDDLVDWFDEDLSEIDEKVRLDTEIAGGAP